jgi:hypothetical protein
MFYRVAGTAPFIVRVNPGAAHGIEERLRAATMEFSYQTEQDEKKIVRYGLFHVQPAIAASVRFQPDYARQVVDVTLRNVDRFETVLLEFQPGKPTSPRWRTSSGSCWVKTMASCAAPRSHSSSRATTCSSRPRRTRRPVRKTRRQPRQGPYT